MTIEEIQEALERITGTDPNSIGRKRALLELLYQLQREQEWSNAVAVSDGPAETVQ